MTSCVRHIEFFFISDIKKLDLSQKHDHIQKEEAECMRKRRGWKWKRVAACFLTAAMLLTMPGMSAFADEADALVTNTGGVNITWNIRRTAVTLRERPGHLVNMSIRKRATPL